MMKAKRNSRPLTPFGQRIKCGLILKRMEQQELARQIGTTTQYIGFILCGARSGAKYKEKICEILGIEDDAKERSA